MNTRKPSRSSTIDQKTLLISPPFQNPYIASMSIVLLAGHLRRHGIPCEEAYLHLDLAELLGRDRYQRINDTTEGRDNGQTAELLFAEGLHGAIADKQLEADLTGLVGDKDKREQLLRAFEARFRTRLRDERPKVVGMTTSFNQLSAALWMTPIIKAVMPEAVVVIGGTACSAPMGEMIAELYPGVDYVVSGYGEEPMLDIAMGDRPTKRVLVGDRPPNLDALPPPDYRRFLRELEVMDPDIVPALIFQTSSGCWWGEKRHCTFCGLNGDRVAFKAKSDERALDDIRTLWERHRTELVATDCIMSRAHLKTLVPKLARFSERPYVFYEMKANLKERDVIAMKAASLKAQVGIESLSTRLLKLMRKGLTAIRALALLKWCREQRIEIVWNQLCRIPGERVEDYDAQIALMEQIPHFMPPNRVNPVIIDRYSPYFEDFEAYGIESLAPIPQYRAAHPHLAEEKLHLIAYHFEGVGAPSTDPYHKRFEAAVATWISRYRKRDGLFWNRFNGLTKIMDGAAERIYVDDRVKKVFEATHDIAHKNRVIEQTGCDAGLVDEMIASGFLYEERGNLINLTARVQR